MDTDMVSCIYCGTQVDPRVGEGDHVIPAQLGEFQGDTHFRRICRTCNSLIGRSEQQLLQCGPERIYRGLVKPASPTGRKRGRSGGKGAMGAPPPRVIVESPSGNSEVVRLDPHHLHNVHPMSQLVVWKDCEEHHVALFPGMRPEQLRKKLAVLGLSDLAGARLHCDDEQWQEFCSLVASISSCRIEEAESTDAGIHRVRGRTTVVVNDHYFRALAKIGFHYYLVHNRRGLRGDEAEFQPLRSFILNGIGDVDAFFRPPDSGPRFVLPFGPTADGRLLAPSVWCHLLAADESTGRVVVYLHLFLGPGVHRPGKYLTLGTVPGKIVPSTACFAHTYVYHDPQPASGTAGRVEPLELTRLR